MNMKKRRFLAVTVGALVLGGVFMVGYGGGITPAAALNNKPPKPNPFQQILDKLDETLAAIAALGGGGGNDGNHTLRWDQNLPAAQRFVVLAAFANAAVLDKNTGLVWEQAPATTVHTWSDARFQCVNKNVGGTRGWRLPSVVELSSLIDPSSPSPFVPASVFTGVLSSTAYWSTSANPDDPTSAWAVFTSLGNVSPASKPNGYRVWCVRGGMNTDQY